jgi:sugar transferase (PEP-CTERM/EpsH1 system associated)
VNRYVALSRDLQTYLVRKVGIAADRIEQIYNGVDAARFHPASGEPVPVEGWPLDTPDAWVVGSVGRMQGVKDPLLLARAFARALALKPDLRAHWRLVMVGDGPLREQVGALLQEAGVAALAWLPGDRNDVPNIMRCMNCFVLPSKAEGISNTILEAMACGLPVVATDVGGNAELVQAGRTGLLVAAGDVDSMAEALLQMHASPQRTQAMGVEARREVERRFSMGAMVGAYQALYDQERARAGQATKRA